MLLSEAITLIIRATERLIRGDADQRATREEGKRMAGSRHVRANDRSSNARARTFLRVHTPLYAKHDCEGISPIINGLNDFSGNSRLVFSITRPSDSDILFGHTLVRLRPHEARQDRRARRPRRRANQQRIWEIRRALNHLTARMHGRDVKTLTWRARARVYDLS